MRMFLGIAEAKGDATTAPYAGQIECLSVTYELDVPRDASGTYQKRRYSPILVTKAWDRSSPAFGAALVASTVYPKAAFTFVAETPSFGAKHLLIELTNVTVRRIDQSGAEGGSLVPLDRVVLDFQGIDITYSPPGVSPKKISDNKSAP